MKNLFVFISAVMSVGLVTGCASDDRRPASFSRAGREYKEPRAMNHRRTDPNTLYDACLRERNEVSCRNRLGR